MTDPHQQLLDDSLHAQAVADRARRRLIAEADDQDATFVDSLHALAEAGATVLVGTTVGRTARGRVDAVGGDHLVVVDATATSYVRIDQVTTVRGTAGAPLARAAASGEGPRPASSSLLDELGGLAHEHSPIDVHLVGGAVVRGEVRRVGGDVLTVRSSSGEETLVHLPLAALLTVHRGRGVST